MPTVETLRQSGRHVIASGLNTDFAGRPFGPMPELLALADDITMLSAICVVCGETATRTQRLVGGRPAAIDDPLIVIGGFDGPAIETYEARCLRHHEVAPAGSARGVVADDGPARVADPAVAGEALTRAPTHDRRPIHPQVVHVARRIVDNSSTRWPEVRGQARCSARAAARYRSICPKGPVAPTPDR